jgi:hypothetical protein
MEDMMQHFNVKNILRKCARPMLADFFEHHGALAHDIDRDWLEDHATKVEEIMEKYLALPQNISRAMEVELQNAHDLASDAGKEILLCQAQAQNVDLASAEEIVGLLERALWFSMNHPDVWEASVRFAQADLVRDGRYWIKRSRMPLRAPNTSNAANERLGKAVSEFFSNKEGRGRQYVVEHHTRPDGGEYYFIYLSDYADAYNGFDESGSFHRMIERHTFEVIFAYYQQEGVLELYAKGGKKLVIEPLQMIFTRTILGMELPPELGAAEYSLDILLNPDFDFDVDPEDGIEKVAIHALTFTVLGKDPSFRFHIKTPKDEGQDSIHDVLDNALTQRSYSRTMLQVQKVTLCLYLAGRGRKKKLSFTVSMPNGCNLKNQSPELATLGRKYMLRWGIDNVAVA